MKVVSVICAALVGLIVATAAKADPVKFRLAMRSSITSPNGKNLVAYKNAVETLSDGRVTIEILDGGKAFTDTQVPEAVRSGALEMAIIQVGLYAKDIPEVAIFQQPFLFDSDAIIEAAIRPESDIRKVIDASILAKMGARVLYWQNYGPTVIISKDGPILEPQSIEHRDVRAFDNVAAEFVSLCGGQPHVLPYAKMLESLQMGKVGAVMSGVFAVREQELWREAKYISRIHHSALTIAVVINENLWQSLPKQDRDMMLAEARKAEIDYENSFALANAEAYRFSVEMGMTVKDITKDQLGEWRLCSSEVVERFIEKLGDTATTSLMTAYGQLRAASCCKSEPAKLEPARSQASR